MKKSDDSKQFLDRIVNLWKILIPDWSRRKFIRCQSEVGGSRGPESSAQILVELVSSSPASYVVSLTQFLPVLNEAGRSCKTVGYAPFLVLTKPLPRLVSLVRDLILWKLGIGPSMVFKFAGVEQRSITWPSLTKSRKARQVVADFFSNSPSLEAISSWTYSGVLFGDLLYDHFLRSHLAPTIEVESASFKRFFRFFAESVMYWLDYFESNDVRAVVSLNHEYGTAIPQRIALSRGIAGFVIRPDRVVSLSKEFPNSRVLEEVQSLREEFAKVAPQYQQFYLEQAKSTLENRLGGKIDKFIGYMSHSSFSSERKAKAFDSSNDFNVVIAAHCMWDAPNLYGTGLFADHWEWMLHLGELSLRTSYRWYVKPHPSFTQQDDTAMKEFVFHFPHITVLQQGIGHHQLIDEGLRAVVTIYGSVGHELPALGIPVINSSPNNYHRDWSFNFHPQSIDELDQILVNLDSYQAPSDARQQIVEYLAAKAYRFQDSAPIFLPTLKDHSLIYDSPDEDFIYQIYSETNSESEIEPNSRGELLGNLKRALESPFAFLQFSHATVRF